MLPHFRHIFKTFYLFNVSIENRGLYHHLANFFPSLLHGNCACLFQSGYTPQVKQDSFLHNQYLNSFIV